MKNLVKIALCLLFSYQWGNAQQIYSSEATQKIKYVVDSLNLKFKKCEFNKIYLSVPQANAHVIIFGGIPSEKERENVMADLKNNIPFAEFEKKYPTAHYFKNQFITLQKYEDYDDKKMIGFNYLDLMEGDKTALSIEEPINFSLKNYKKNHWYYNFNHSYAAIFLLDDFSQKKIDKKYTAMIDYVDCMVDTTTNVIIARQIKNDENPPLLKEFKERVFTYEREFITKNKRILSKKQSYSYSQDFEQIENPHSYLAMTKDNNRFFSVAEFKVFLKEETEEKTILEKWHQDMEAHIRNNINKDPVFIQKVYENCIENYTSDELFEEYATKSLKDEQMLELKRRRLVTGSCSMDTGPATHAMEIANLAGKTAKWNIFLRSHLDVMNDRFESVAKSSFGEAHRFTFVGELENLNLNTLDLLLGMSFRLDNAAQNHYFGNINRIGRALAESKKIELIETRILEILSDTSLDQYNRVSMYFLFLSYIQQSKNPYQKLDQLQKTLENTKEPLWKKIDYITLKKAFSYKNHSDN